MKAKTLKNNNLSKTYNTMEKLHHKINLRAMLIEVETTKKIKKYGKNSATVKSKYFKENIGIFISYVIKNI